MSIIGSISPEDRRPLHLVQYFANTIRKHNSFEQNNNNINSDFII